MFLLFWHFLCWGYSLFIHAFIFDKDLQQDFFQENPPPYPEFIDALLYQSLVSKNLSESTLTDMNELQINLKKSRDFLQIPLYLTLLELTLGVIDIEVQYQQGKIDDEQLSVGLQKLAAEALKTQQAAPKLPE